MLGYWVRMYELASGKECPINFTPNTIIAFNTVISSVRNLYKFNDGNEEIKLAILYGYTHDPLNLGDPTKYGDVHYLYKVVGAYKQWRRTKYPNHPPALVMKEMLFSRTIETSDLLTKYMKELLGVV